MEAADFNWFDIIVISIVAFSTLFALLRGFMKALFSLVTWIMTIAGTLYSYPFVSDYLSGNIANEKVVMALSSIGIFLLLFIIIAVINAKILDILHAHRGGIVDRTLGFSFGLARGILIVCLVFFCIDAVSKMLHYGDDETRAGPGWFVDAKTYNTLQVLTMAGISFVPDDTMEELVEFIGQAKDLSVSVMSGNGLSDSSIATTGLTPDNRDTIQKLIDSIPKEDLKELYSKYESDISDLSGLEKMSFFRDVLELYNKSVENDVVDKGIDITEEELKNLESSLDDAKKGQEIEDFTGFEDETGYKQRNIKQLDRLVESL